MNGFREGRSPDVLGVADGTLVYTDLEGLRMPWPAAGTLTDTRVPIVFAGAGVTSGASVPNRTTLDRVAPTVSEILGFEREHPEVRSGTAVAGIANGEPPSLVLLVGWKGVGSSELENHPQDWPFLSSLLDDGAGTLEGETGSLPIDPAATLTTVGTGGLPSQHGITGSFIRDGEGEVAGGVPSGLARGGPPDHRDARGRPRRREPLDARRARRDRRTRSRDRRRRLVSGRGSRRRGDRRQRRGSARRRGAPHDRVRSGRRPRCHRRGARGARSGDGPLDPGDRHRGRARHVGVDAGRGDRNRIR